MTSPNRRTLILSLLLASSIPLAHAAGSAAQVQVVYHVADGLDQAQRALINIRNHMQAEPDTKIVLVALGNGVDFLLEGAKDRSGQAFEASIAALAAQGVQFRVCKNTLTARKIDPNKVALEAKTVSSGVAEVARLQAREGYAYLRP